MEEVAVFHPRDVVAAVSEQVVPLVELFLVGDTDSDVVNGAGTLPPKLRVLVEEVDDGRAVARRPIANAVVFLVDQLEAERLQHARGDVDARREQRHPVEAANGVFFGYRAIRPRRSVGRGSDEFQFRSVRVVELQHRLVEPVGLDDVAPVGGQSLPPIGE